MDWLPLLGIVVPSILGLILVVLCTYFLINVCYKKWKSKNLNDDTEALASRDEVDSVDYDYNTFCEVDNPQFQQNPDQSSVSSCALSVIDERATGTDPTSTTFPLNIRVTETVNASFRVHPRNRDDCAISSYHSSYNSNVSNPFEGNQVTVVEINAPTYSGDHLRSSTPTPLSTSPSSQSPSSSETSWATAGTTTPTAEIPLHFDNIYDLALAGSRRRSKSLPMPAFLAITNDVCSSSTSPIPKFRTRSPVSRRLDFQDDSISIYEEQDCEVVKIKRPRNSLILGQPEHNLKEDEFDYILQKCDNELEEWKNALLKALRNSCRTNVPKPTDLLDDRYISTSFMKEGIKCLQDIQEEKDLKIIYLAQNLILHKQPRDFGVNGTQVDILTHPPLIIGVDATKDHMAGYLVNLKSKVIKFYVINNSESPWTIFQRYCPIEFEMKNFLLALCIWNKDIVDHGKFAAYTDNNGVNSSSGNYGCWVQELLKHFTSCRNAVLVNKDSYVNRRTDLEAFSKFIQPADDLSRFEIGNCVNFLCEYYFIGKENVTGTHTEKELGNGKNRYEKAPYYDAVLRTAVEFINSFECANCKNERLNLSLRDDLNVRQTRRCASLSPPKSKRKKHNKAKIFRRSNSSN
ncbi:unnamed protein product [Orchesella dallaii]|uniref:Uncharacterized protein n=1 Tax=Orchesella dallaii TaxID=48710 RepID=A0ABP1QLK1_9HEXA